MKIQVITPKGSVCEQEADCVIVPAVDGEMGILNNHAPMLAELGNGEAVVKSQGSEQKIAIEGGFIQIDNNVVGILAESASLVD